MSSTILPLREHELPGPVPRFEIPGWREELGVIGGITGRGTGPAPGFDLGLWTDNPVGQVMSRWRALRGAEPGFRCTVLGNQVHGTDIVWHEGGTGWVQVEGVDGHCTRASGLLLTVTAADCIPVYLLAPSHHAIALLHCGWRGTAAGLIHTGIEALVEGSGAKTSDIIMHCGVGICGACYEVGREVMDGCAQKVEGKGPWHLDLRAVLSGQARDRGVTRISTSEWCSSHDRPAFYSHRASGGRDGRMVAYLGMPLG